MGTTKPNRMDDVEHKDYTGDGKSTIDIYSVPEQLTAPDGESSVDIEGEYAGFDRVTESIQNNVADLSVEMTSEPSGKGNDSARSYGTAPSAPVAPTSAENLNPAQQETPETVDSEAPKKRGRPRKDATTTSEKDSATSEETK